MVAVLVEVCPVYQVFLAALWQKHSPTFPLLGKVHEVGDKGLKIVIKMREKQKQHSTFIPNNKRNLHKVNKTQCSKGDCCYKENVQNANFPSAFLNTTNHPA